MHKQAMTIYRTLQTAGCTGRKQLWPEQQYAAAQQIHQDQDKTRRAALDINIQKATRNSIRPKTANMYCKIHGTFSNKRLD